MELKTARPGQARPGYGLPPFLGLAWLLNKIFELGHDTTKISNYNNKNKNTGISLKFKFTRNLFEI